jgi:ATP-dependent exoDNAse (exonuclease V) alpha subunit
MQIENDNDKDVYNGDIGYIEDVDPDAGELTASFDGGTGLSASPTTPAIVPMNSIGKLRATVTGRPSRSIGRPHK